MSRGRRTIENTFGILCAKWRILQRPIETISENAVRTVLAIAYLHNFLMTNQNDDIIQIRIADNPDEENGFGEWMYKNIHLL